MANEKITDRMVQRMLDTVGLDSVPNASSVKEVSEALRTASKRQTGNSGFPEFTAQIKDFLLVIEDKAETSKQVRYEDISAKAVALDSKSAGDYALNGAIHYGKHIAENTNFKKVFAVGVSGDEKHHIIQPAFINGKGDYNLLPEIDTFENFSLENIDSYYRTSVLNEVLPEHVQQEELMSFAKKLHEDLRNYGALLEEQKPIVVSAILLALEDVNFTPDGLVGNSIETDGTKVFRALRNYLLNAEIPENKREVVLERFNFIKNGKMSEIDSRLGKTPMKFFVEQIRNKMGVAHEDHPSHDILGKFYGEFVKYSGGDGKGLGIVLTPKHITDLFCDLLDIKPNDKVLDPCCGTSGFLISAMDRMLEEAHDDVARTNIKRHQLHGVELQPNMFAVATTNMILRGDGKSNLRLGDFMEIPIDELRQQNYTVGMMNPPYSQAKSKDTAHLSEISFTQHLLDSMAQGGRVAIIVPQSTMVGKTTQDRQIKKEILKKHTLESVITLNKDTFYGVGVNAAIAIFTTYVPHKKDKIVKFFNFEDDGWELRKGGLVANEQRTKDQRKRLLDVYHDISDASTDFVVKTTVEDSDEWLHAFYYFNDLPPSDADFEKTMADYLTFEFDMIAQGRGYLFEEKYDDKN